MAVYNSTTHRWILDSIEANFTMPFGTTNDGIEGNALNNTLVGDNGNNVIRGYGGDDTFIGGLGNDDYEIHSINDIVIEDVGEGIDYLSIVFESNQSIIDNYILPNNIENGYV